MRAYVIKEFGVPGAIEERAMPQPAAGELLIDVRAAGVNAMDAVVVAGYAKDWMEHRFPLTPGLDLSGIVRAVGEGVTDRKVGDEIFGIAEKAYMGDGTFAEQVVVRSASVVPKPAELDHTQAASLPTASLTALAAVNSAAVQKGQTVVILGATGGVGSFATQLAALRRAKVIAVTKAEYVAYAKDLGAVEVIDYTAGDVATAARSKAGAVDAVLDFVGDASLLEALASLVRKGGYVASAAAMIDPEVYKAKGLIGQGIQRGPVAGLPEIVELIHAKQLRLPAIRTLPLGKAADALAEQAQRHMKGKLVLTVN